MIAARNAVKSPRVLTAERTNENLPRDGSRSATVDRNPSARVEREAAAVRVGGQCVPMLASRTFWLRVLFFLDVFGAGVPGVLLLVSPNTAGEWLFAGQLNSGSATEVLGCVWLALGVAAIAGVYRPFTFSPLLLVQLAYKAIWLTAVALPAAWAGLTIPPALTAIVAGWVIAVGVALPWRDLFGRREEVVR